MLVMLNKRRLYNCCTPYLISVSLCDLLMTGVMLPAIGLNGIFGRVVLPNMVCKWLSICFHCLLGTKITTLKVTNQNNLSFFSSDFLGGLGICQRCQMCRDLDQRKEPVFEVDKGLSGSHLAAAIFKHSLLFLRFLGLGGAHSNRIFMLVFLRRQRDGPCKLSVTIMSKLRYLANLVIKYIIVIGNTTSRVKRMKGHVASTDA